MALTAHEIARVQLAHVGPGFHDFADELMAGDERHGYVRLRPAIPLIDVQVRAADTGSEYADQHIVPAYRGDWNILKPEAGLGSRLDQRFHSAPGRSPFALLRSRSTLAHPCVTPTQHYRPAPAGLRDATAAFSAPSWRWRGRLRCRGCLPGEARGVDGLPPQPRPGPGRPPILDVDAQNRSREQEVRGARCCRRAYRGNRRGVCGRGRRIRICAGELVLGGGRASPD